MRDVVIYAQSPGLADATASLLRSVGDLRSVTCVGEAEDIWPVLAASAAPLLVLCVPVGDDVAVASFLNGFRERWRAYGHVPVLATRPPARFRLGVAPLNDAARGRLADVSLDDLAGAIEGLDGSYTNALRARLSPRQLAVAQLVVEGLTNGEIARQLGCSTATVKAHLALIFKKFGVSNRVQAARSFLERRTG